jgi:hypothetical protein
MGVLKGLAGLSILGRLDEFCLFVCHQLVGGLAPPMEWLNAPIYYGPLYGSFAWVYVHVKRQICQEANSLPVLASSW